jgi:PAS domain S-box-containing protein
MSAERREGVPAVRDREIEAVLPERVRLALWIVLGGSLVFATASVVAGDRSVRAALLLNGALMLCIGTLLGWLAQRPAHATVIGRLAVVAVAVVSCTAGILAGDAATAPLLIIALTLSTALAFPWGARAQAHCVVVALAAMLATVLGVYGRLTAVPLPTIIAALIPLAASLSVAREHVRIVAATLAQAGARERAEAQLEGERRFRALIEHSSDVIVVLDRDLNILYAGGNIEASLGWDADALLGHAGVSYLHPDDLAQVPALLDAILRPGGRVGPIELRVRRRDGGWVHYELTAKNLLDDPLVQGIVINSRDVTERKRSEAEREALLAVAHDLSGTLDAREIVARVQPRAAAVLACDRVTTLFRDRARGVFRVIGHFGIPPDLVEAAEALEFGPGDGVLEPIQRGETMVINDPRTQPWMAPEYLEAFGVGAVLGIPLVVHEQTVGVLSLTRPRGAPPFTAAEVRLGQGIADQLALALAMADLYEREQEEAAVGAALAQVGRELIGALGAPALVERLCALTTAVLPSDSSQTFLWRPEDDTREAIFEPFYQADGGGRGGAGLGLYIARRLVEALGGTLDLESVPGRGATFRLFFPHEAARQEA